MEIFFTFLVCDYVDVPKRLLAEDNPASALDLMVIDALSRVKLPNPEQIANSYPHELSGECNKE